MGAPGFQELDQEPVKDDLPAVVTEVDNPSCQREDPFSVIDHQPFCEFLPEECGKIGCYRMPLDAVIKRIPDHRGKYKVPEAGNAGPDFPAHGDCFCISLILELPERIRSVEHLVRLTMDVACDLGMA